MSSIKSVYKDDYMKKKDILLWNKISYEDSLDYYLSLLLEPYNLNIKEVIVWYYDKEKDILIFQYHFHYYLLHNKKFKEISEDDVWHQKK